MIRNSAQVCMAPKCVNQSLPHTTTFLAEVEGPEGEWLVGFISELQVSNERGIKSTIEEV